METQAPPITPPPFVPEKKWYLTLRPWWAIAGGVSLLVILSLLAMFSLAVGLIVIARPPKTPAKEVAAVEVADPESKIDWTAIEETMPAPRTKTLERALCQPMIEQAFLRYQTAKIGFITEPPRQQEHLQAMLLAQSDLMYAVASLLAEHDRIFRGQMLNQLSPTGRESSQEARRWVLANPQCLFVAHAADDGNLKAGHPAALTGPVRVLQVEPRIEQALIRLDYGDRFYDWRIHYELAHTLKAGQWWPEWYDAKLTPIIVPLTNPPKGGVGEAIVVCPPHKLHAALTALGKTHLHFISQGTLRRYHYKLAKDILTPQVSEDGILDRSVLQFADWPLRD